MVLLSLVVVVVGVIFLKKPARPVHSGPSVKDFALMDQNGRLTELYRQKNAKAVVLVSYGIGCPIARKMIPRLQELAALYERENIRFFLIDANLNDDREKIIQEAREFNIPVPVLIDDTQRVSQSLGINRTGELLLIETSNWNILFRGPLDDRLGYGFEKAEADKPFFESALANFLAGKEIPVGTIPALGCAITFENLQVNYHKDIAPILNKKCAECHLRGNAPPTNLGTYQDVKNWSQMIAEVLRTERMPPWEADSFFLKVKGDLSLTAEEKRKIYSWIESSFPEGSPSENPSAKEQERKDIDFKSPIRFRPKRPLEIPASTPQPWYYEELIVDNPADLWFSALRFHADNPAVLQHLALIVMKERMDLSKGSFQPEFQNQEDQIYNIIRFTPFRQRALRFGENLAYRFPKGSYVYLEVHLSPTGKNETLDLTLDLEKFTSKKTTKELVYTPLTLRNLKIPANQEKVVLTTTKTLDKDTYIHSLGPHMHWRGHYSRLSLVDAHGARTTLFSGRYLFKNRRAYRLDKPLLIKAGSTLEAEFEFDNSASNPASINYKESVSYGADALKNEMGVFHLTTYSK